MEIAVCSWSYRLSAERVAEEMTKCDVKNVHLALNPFVVKKGQVRRAKLG